MKKTISMSLMLALMTIWMLSCKKENAKTTSTSSSNNTSNTNTPPNNFPMTAQDSALVGYWILDKKEEYVNGSMVTSTNHNDPSFCFLDLKAALVLPNSTSDFRKATHSLDCVTIPNGQWRINSTKLELMNGMYTINTLTSNNLVIQIGSISAPNGAYIYYLHK